MLRSFPQDDRDHMVENGKITVTCEFCNSSYVFEPAEVNGAASAPSHRRVGMAAIRYLASQPSGATAASVRCANALN